jgi:hypothetical protein
MYIDTYRGSGDTAGINRKRCIHTYIHAYMHTCRGGGDAAAIDGKSWEKSGASPSSHSYTYMHPYFHI